MAPRRLSPMLHLLTTLSSMACATGPDDIYADLLRDDDPQPLGNYQGRPGEGEEDDEDEDEEDDEDDDGDQDVDVKFDVGMPDGGPADVDEEEARCRAVDLLFLIDDSGSMGDEQLNLVASFPGFIDGIRSLLGAATSTHVGVITTGDYTFDVPQCQPIGSLRTKTGGELSSDEQCGPYAEGGSYMTEADDLDAAFSCAAKVGIDGDGIEKPMDALRDALLDPAGTTAACNADFLRDDALLVVVLISDEEDLDKSAGNPIDWYDNVVAAKGGSDEDVVMLSLIGHAKPNDCIAAQWTGMMGAEISPRLIAFTELFQHGIVGDVCSPSYAPFFAEAIDGIAEACEIPAG